MKAVLAVSVIVIAFGLAACDQKDGAKTIAPTRPIPDRPSGAGENSVSESPPQQAAPTIGGNADLRYVVDDQYSRGFLDLSISCGAVTATMEDFLEIRSSQVRPDMIMKYSIFSDHTGEKPLVYVHEKTTRGNGEALPGWPVDTIYTYVIDWPFFRYVSTVPKVYGNPDPLSFMNNNPDPVCNGMLARNLRNSRAAHPGPLPTDTASPTKSQTSDKEVATSNQNEDARPPPGNGDSEDIAPSERAYPPGRGTNLVPQARGAGAAAPQQGVVSAADDGARAERAHRYQVDFRTMVWCVINRTPVLIQHGLRDRAAIKAQIRAACVNTIVTDGFMTDPGAQEATDRMVDRRLSELQVNGR